MRRRRTTPLARHNMERALRQHESLLVGTVGLNAGAAYGAYTDLLRCDTTIVLDLLQRPGVDLQGDLHCLPLRSESADVVLLTEVLEHLRQPWNALRECHRVLRPGGIVLITTRFMYPFHAEPHDYYRYTDEGLRELLSEFESVTTVPLGNRAHVLWTAISEVRGVRRVLRRCNPLIARLQVRQTRWADGYLAVGRR